jgi:hypothetical protein
MELTGHSKILGPLLSPIWHLQFGGCFQIFGKFVDSWATGLSGHIVEYRTCYSVDTIGTVCVHYSSISTT